MSKHDRKWMYDHPIDHEEHTAAGITYHPSCAECNPRLISQPKTTRRNGKRRRARGWKDEVMA